MGKHIRVFIEPKPLDIYMGERFRIGSYKGTCLLNLFGRILIAIGWNN